MTGRAVQFGQLRTALHKSYSGQQQIVCLTGTAGIGKSTLVQEALTAEPAFFECCYHCFESTAVPYAPLAHACRMIDARFGLKNLNLALLPHLGILMPEIGQPAARPDRNLLGDALRECFAAVSRRGPMVLVIEDCHWIDAATLEILKLLAEGLAGEPFALVITYRDDAIHRDHALVRLRSQWRRRPSFLEIRLAPLQEEESVELITAILPEHPAAALCTILYQHTGGLPFFVKELTLSMLEKKLLKSGENGMVLVDNASLPLPESIRDMIMLQLDGVTGDLRETLDIAALIGQEFSLELLGMLTDRDEDVDRLLSLSIIHEKAADKGTFIHALYPEVIRQDIPWSRRKSLNRRIALALETQNASSERIGKHWLDAGEKDKARLAFAAAAAAYCPLGAHSDTARIAQMSLDLWPKGKDEEARLELLWLLAGCTRVANQVHHSILALREILESPLVAGNDFRTAEAWRALAISYALQGTWQHYKNCRIQAAEHYQLAGIFENAAADWHELCNRHIDEQALADALQVIEKAIQCAKDAGRRDLHSRSTSLKAYALAMQGQAKLAEEMAQEAIRIAVEGNFVEATAYAYRKLAGVLEYSSDYKGSIRAYETALNFCRSENLSEQAQFCTICMCWILFRLGEWKRALDMCREQLNNPQINDNSKALGFLVTGLIRCFRGEGKSARKNMDEAFPMIAQTGFDLLAPIMIWGQALTEEMDSHPDSAYHHYHQLIQFWHKCKEPHDLLPGLMYGTHFFSSHGHEDECQAILQILSSIANQTGNPEAVATLSFALAEAAGRKHDFAEALTHYSYCESSFEKLAIPSQQMVVLLRYGKMLLLHGKQDLAQEKLTGALRIARSLGMRPAMAEIGQLLGAANEEPQSPTFPNSDGTLASLTERQTSILKSLAEGMSNKEIAVRYNLSTRTVDMHVRNIFERLNCRTRTEAVRYVR